MEHLHAATLRIAFESPHIYRLLYTVRDQHGGAAQPYTIHGREQLQSVLTRLGLNDAEIVIIGTRVEAGISYVLDLSHIDRATAERVLQSFSQSLC